MGKFKNQSPFEIFDFSPTMSEKELKIQYSKLIKKYKPTESPEEFIEIHEAYTFFKRLLNQNSTSHKYSDISSSENTSNKLVINESLVDYRWMMYIDLCMGHDVDPFIIKKFFDNSDDLCKEIITFHNILSPTHTSDYLRSLLRLSSASKAAAAYEAFLFANRIITKVPDDFTQLEKTYFCCSANKAIKYFEEIVTNSSFTYPYNYLLPDIFDRVRKRNKKTFINYINSIPVSNLPYLNYIFKNKTIINALSKEKQVDFFLSSISSLKTRTETLEKKYINRCLKEVFKREEVTNPQLLTIYHLLDKKNPLKDISHIQNFHECLPLITVINAYNLKDVKMDGNQKFFLNSIRNPYRLGSRESTKRLIVVGVLLLVCFALFTLPSPASYTLGIILFIINLPPLYRYKRRKRK